MVRPQPVSPDGPGPRRRSRLESRARGSFAGNEQQRVGNPLAYVAKHAHEEFDILLVRDAPDEQHDWSGVIDAQPRPERDAITRFGPLRIDARRDDAHVTIHPVAAEGVTHRRRGHHDRVHVIALRARESPRGESQSGARQPRQVVVQVFLEIRVVRLDDGQRQAPGEPHAEIMRDERRVDVHDIERTGAQPRQ